MSYRSRYGTYRGKSGFRTFLKVVIVILLVVLILMVAGFFVLEKYMVYDANGARLVLPFFQQGDAPEALPEVSAPLIVETPEPTPTPLPKTLHAVLLPRTALSDGTAAAQVQAMGGNAAVFDMKADDGTLGYVSALELAKAVGASAADPGLNAAIQALNSGELHTVARVSCFRDNTAPYRQNKLAIKTNSGYNWKDQDGVRWTSPTNEAARQYAVDVCVELAGLGFDEILLDCCAYPTEGNLGYIKKGDAYNQDQFAMVVAAFYAQVRQALVAYPEVKLSIMTTEGTITAGSDAMSGQSVAGMLQSADRLWAPLSGSGWTQCAALLAQAGLEEPEQGLVSVSAIAGTEQQSWAMMGALSK